MKLKYIKLYEYFTNDGETAQTLDMWSEIKEILPSWSEIVLYLKDKGHIFLDPIFDIESYIKLKHEELKQN